MTGPINLGNPGEFTMLEHAEEVVKLVGGDTRIEYLPLPQDDPVRRQPDITQAEQVLGWQTTAPLDEGTKTVDHFRRTL